MNLSGSSVPDYIRHPIWPYSTQSTDRFAFGGLIFQPGNTGPAGLSGRQVLSQLCFPPRMLALRRKNVSRLSIRLICRSPSSRIAIGLALAVRLLLGAHAPDFRSNDLYVSPKCVSASAATVTAGADPRCGYCEHRTFRGFSAGMTHKSFRKLHTVSTPPRNIVLTTKVDFRGPEEVGGWAKVCRWRGRGRSVCHISLNGY
jgi:hypothetical protein